LWEDGEFVVCRGSRRAADGNRSAVLAVLPAAEHPAPASIDRLAHEYSLKEDLESAWAVRPLELVRDRDRTILVLEDPGGEPLDRHLGQPMEVRQFLSLAIDIVAALGEVHRRGLVHKDLKPAHILVNGTNRQVHLTGFGFASRLRRERQVPGPPEFIAGTLAYMAPEQTGRMNRSVDLRSDLYALGVTFYQMLTAALPFTASDPMEWIHCHIARTPVPPHARLANIPVPVSQIVTKLLAKTAEERYQTAGAVECDLRRCLAEWQASGRIDPFLPGHGDAPDWLSIPEKLYGREREIAALVRAFDRVTTRGSPELVLISGYSGIGKSSVVNELHKALVPKRGFFASGKFDQHKRDIPYRTLAQAFQGLIRGFLSKSDAELEGWRTALRETLWSDGQLMVDLVPELEVIIGGQPPIPDCPPQQAQNLFKMVFRRFVGVFAQPEHPLALFLDDLHWADAATLDVLEDLLTRSDLQHLLLIGAYRDTRVDATHPLARKLDAMRKASAKIEQITLEPLGRKHVKEFIADALRCAPARAAPLAHLVHDKTGGNPFFAIRFLSELADEGLVSFDPGAAGWAWDLDRIRAKGYTENVIDLMVGKISRLTRDTQAALQQLACLGSVAETGLLATALATSESQVHEALWEAIRDDLVERLNGSYRFIHDRVLEAAYSLIPDGQRAEAHLRIGRLLMARTPPERREEAVFELVNQLNRGSAQIASAEEREQVAELNLTAGRRARASTAYASALRYFTTGRAFLAEDCWERRRELIFELELHAAQCEFLTGALGEAEKRLAWLTARAVDLAERAAVACLQIDVYLTLDHASQAIGVGLEYLRHIGLDWSTHPTDEEARREYERVWSELSGPTTEDLMALPLMTDRASIATLDVLNKFMLPAFYSDVNLFTLAVCRAISLTLEHGNSDASPVAYVRFALIAGGRFGQPRVAYRVGQLGYELGERCGLRRFQAGVYLNLGNMVMPWTRHVKTGHDLIRRAYDAARNTGDLTYAVVCSMHLVANLLASSDPLPEVQREAENALAFAQKVQFGSASELIGVQLALVRMLRGLTPKFGSLHDEQFERRIEASFARNPDARAAECWYWIRKLQARFFAGDYPAALEVASKAQPLVASSLTTLEAAVYHYYSALAHAAACNSIQADRRAPHLEVLAAHHRQLESWAANCPDNFENRLALVGAEIARLSGRELEAERLYDQAIRSARANGFDHHEAIANERAAHFYAARARMHLSNARDAYLRWGADGKARGWTYTLETRRRAPLRRPRPRLERLSKTSTSQP
jgi:predicted ATPase